MNDPIPFSTAEQSIHGRFDDIVAMIPEHPALSDGIHSLTYLQLQKASNKLAHAILGILGPGKGNIGIFCENNVFQVIAILGILRSGRSYVALDTSFPDERNKAILNDSQSRMIVCTEDLRERLSGYSEDRFIISADQPGEEIPECKPQIRTDPGDNAITLYTSGSTGRPKGVLQSHRNMVHFIRRMSDLYPIYPSDKTAYYLSFGFSAHALPLLGALLNGSELKTYSFRKGNFHAFSEWLRTEKISFGMMIPSFLRHFLAVQEKKTHYPDLRLLLFGGETLYRSDVEKARAIFRKQTFMVNIYASTEAYLMRSFPLAHDTTIKSNIVPIGYPVEGMEISLQDAHGKQVRGQEQGEIILKSEYLTEGYHRQPELQKKDFSTDPVNPALRIFSTADMGYFLDDNCLVHTGRKDSVVKLRGYRIDFGEIINLLLQSNDVREAVCVLRENPGGREELIAYIVPAGAENPDMEYIRALLVRVLPDFMIPSYIIPIGEIPKNSVGKTDPTALPDPEWEYIAEQQKEAPANQFEEKLCRIFEKVLKKSTIGVNEDFLKLGADSLGLFVALSEVEKEFGVKIDLKTSVATPNIRSLAKHIQSSGK